MEPINGIVKGTGPSTSDGLTVTTLPLGVQLVKLVTGEEIIGDVTVTPEGVSIEGPMIPNVVPNNDNGSYRISLFPYRPYVKASVPILIAGQHVIAVMEITEQIEQSYRQFRSNIKIASPGDVPAFRSPIV
jgi:hypothetical protein